MGRVIISGGARATVPSTGIKVSTLPVGTIIKLFEDGTYVDFMIVNQGNPDASMYDSSCDGCWVLRKDILVKSIMYKNETAVDYEGSKVYNYFTDFYIPNLGAIEQSVIKQVNIPSRYRAGVDDEIRQTSVKVFLLSVFEVGGTTTQFPGTMVDGATLKYFEDNLATTRIAQYDDPKGGIIAAFWWLRTSSGNSIWFISSDGSFSSNSADLSYGVRPALILPSTAKLNDNYELIG